MGTSIDKFRNDAVFPLNFQNHAVVVANVDNGLKNKKTGEQDQSGTYDQEGDQQRHHLDELVKSRGGYQYAQDRKGQDEYRDPRPQSGQGRSLFRQQQLDFIEE